MSNEYFVIKKTMDGVYLLDSRQELISHSTDYNLVKDSYDKEICKVQKQGKIFFVCKTDNDKFLKVINMY